MKRNRDRQENEKSSYIRSTGRSMNMSGNTGFRAGTSRMPMTHRQDNDTRIGQSFAHIVWATGLG